MFNRSTSLYLTHVLFVSQSFMSAAQIAIFTMMAIVSAELSGSENFAGLPSSLLTLSIAVTAIPIALFMSRFGRRWGLAISYALSGIGAIFGIIAIVQGWFWLLLLSSAFIGMGRAGGDQSRFIAGEIFPEAERARMIGRIVSAGTIGGILGPLLVEPSKWLTNYLSHDTDTGPWVLGTIFYVIATLIILFFLRPEPMQVARELEGEAKKKKNDAYNGRSLKEMLRSQNIQLAILSMLISQVVMVTLMVITPLHMKHLGHEAGAISFVISAHVLGMYGFSAFTGRMIDRFGRVPMMIVGALTLLVSAVIAPLGAELPFLILGLFLLGLGWSFGYIAGSSLLADSVQGDERSRMQGVSDMLISGVAAISSLGSGFIFGSGGYGAVAGMSIVLILLFLWLMRLLKPVEALAQTV